MGSLYVKGSKLWARYKDEHGAWKGAPTPYRPGDEANARRFVKTLEAASDAKSSFRRRTAGERKGPIAVAGYAERWVADRKQLGLVSACDDDARLKLHAFRHGPALDSEGLCHREEVQTLISDVRILEDRRLVYALKALAALWRNRWRKSATPAGFETADRH